MLKGNGIKVKIQDQVIETLADEELSRDKPSDISFERKLKKVQKAKEGNFLKVVRKKISDDPFFQALN